MSKYDKTITQLYDGDDTKFTYYMATEKIVIRAGENGVTEEWIHTLKEIHRVERNGIRREQMNSSLDAIGELVGDKSLDLSCQEPSLEEIYLRKEEHSILRERMRAALECLSLEQKELLIMVRLRGKSISSIARERGLHESSIRERLKRIEKKLRAILTVETD